MKYFFLLYLLSCGVCQASAQNITPKDSVQILSVINDWNKAWQTKDYILAAKGYSEEARFTNAFGDKRIGKSEVETLLKEVFALPFVMAGSSETTNHTYQVLNSTNTIIHTSVIRKGQKMPDGSVLPDRQTTHMRVFQKKGDSWEIIGHLISDARDKQLIKH